MCSIFSQKVTSQDVFEFLAKIFLKIKIDLKASFRELCSFRLDLGSESNLRQNQVGVAENKLCKREFSDLARVSVKFIHST